MSFKVFFTGFLNKKTYPKKNFLIEQFYIDKHNFDKKINFTKIDIPYSLIEFRKSYDFLNQKKFLYKNCIIKYLKIKFPKRKNFWDKTVDYWLIHFLSSIHIKYQKLKKIKKKYPDIRVFKLDPKKLHPINQTSDFIELIEYSDALNIYIYQKIAEVLNIKLIDCDFKGTGIPKLLKNRNHEKKIQQNKTILRKIKFMFINLYCILREPYLLVDVYASRKFKIKCFLKSYGKFLPVSFESIFNDTKMIIKKENLKYSTLRISEKDEFDRIINNLINQCFPKILYQNFDLKKLNFLKNIKGIFSSINLTSQDYFRFMISVLEKKKIFTLQHGGLYNMQKKNLIEDFEKKNSTFLGWDRSLSYRAFFDHKFLQKKTIIEKKNFILFTTIKNINIVRYESETTDFKTNNDLVKNNIVFYKNLNSQIRDLLIIRFPKHSYEWDLKGLWIKQLKNLKKKIKPPIFNNFDKAEIAISNSKIFICDHISTAFFEALYCGVPIVMFDNLKKYDFNVKTLKLLSELKKNNIIHDSPQKCATFINNNYNNIDNWWNDRKIQKSINNLKKFIFSKDNELNLLNFNK